MKKGREASNDLRQQIYFDNHDEIYYLPSNKNACRDDIGCPMPTRSIIDQIASDKVLEEAFSWLCKSRKDHSHNSDVWELRRRWKSEKAIIKDQLRHGKYRFDTLQEIRTEGEIIELWRARDALILRALTVILGEILQPVLADRCFHVKGRGGIKKALAEVRQTLDPAGFVMKSDVKSYYASIDHDILYAMIEVQVQDKTTLDLVWQYLHRTVVYGENYREVKQGLSLRCSLSPLMGALYLLPLDRAMAKFGRRYTRFMDDWIIIVKKHQHLRKAVIAVNQVLNELKLKQHPDKTFIGKAVKGFDFLGFTFSPQQTTVSKQTIAKARKRIARLYEQDAKPKRIREYAARFCRWVRSVEPESEQNECEMGITGVVSPFPCPPLAY